MICFQRKFKNRNKQKVKYKIKLLRVKELTTLPVVRHEQQKDDSWERVYEVDIPRVHETFFKSREPHESFTRRPKRPV